MRLPCSAAAAAALALACHAQKTDTPPTAYDEVITLEEFYVGAAAPDSYIVSESMGGTRTGAKILETPSMVQVITSEFMEDFQTLDDYNDLPMIASYTPEGDDGRGGAPGRLRGFSPIKMRDGFPRTVLPTLANTKQAEAIMGPQSALYGQASPGGIINYVSKRPSATTRRYLTLAAGSNDYRRAELEL
ncbi:MAG: TonB-dependent receptor plug domain-containing protein, partial [Opitutaceae bacterium]|nr:TonB-dependent receptor plug domain-containing protein [Opitutaceae bacterium]